MTDIWLRSPIHGLGSWEIARPCSMGRLASLFIRWYSYSQDSESASVTGVKKLKPFGTAVIGRLLPREKPIDELVPRRVST